MSTIQILRLQIWALVVMVAPGHVQAVKIRGIRDFQEAHPSILQRKGLQRKSLEKTSLVESGVAPPQRNHRVVSSDYFKRKDEIIGFISIILNTVKDTVKLQRFQFSTHTCI